MMSVFVAGSDQTQSKLQSPTPAASQAEPAAISHVKVVLLEKDSPAIEITSSHPVVPNINKLKDPPRLVIDLPNANMSVRRKRILVHNENVSAIRLEQYSTNPPGVRVVVDLLNPVSYTWDHAGNRLFVRLHVESEEVTAKPPSVPALTKGPEPVAVPVSPEISANVVLADSLASGASLSSGSETTILRLKRGGEVRVCPGTTVSVMHSKNGPDLMLGMSTGAVETHYSLENSADVIITPDFRILLRGPGEFHYAISADTRGNTCVRTLPGNTAPAIVSELIGDGSFQVEPREQLVFHSGQLNSVDTAFHSGHVTPVRAIVPEGCGCPERTVPVMRASLPPATPAPDEDVPKAIAMGPQPARPATPQPAPTSTSPMSSARPGPQTAAVPDPRRNPIHVQAEAALVFPTERAPVSETKSLPLADRSVSPPNVVLPPSSASRAQTQAKKPHKGVFGKIGGFFAGIFH